MFKVKNIFAKKDTPKKYSGVFGRMGTGSPEKGAPTDLEFLSELAPPDGLRKYLIMKRNDPIVGALVLELTKLISGLQYSFIGNDRGVDFISHVFDAMQFRRILLEMTDVFVYGFYLGEKIYAVDGGDVIYTDIEPRFPPSILKINNEDGMVEQNTTKGTLFIPYPKCVHFTVVSESRDPFGVSLLRHIFKSYYYKISIEAVEATSIDRDLAGLPVLTSPEGFDWAKADQNSPLYDVAVAETLEWALKLVRDVRKDNQQGVVKPYGWEFELLKGDNRTSVPTNDIIARHNTEMSVGLLQAFLSLGSFASTNNANVEMTLQNFLTACDSFALQFAEAINRQVIAPLCELNNIDVVQLVFRKTENSHLKSLITMLTTLADRELIKPTPEIEKKLLSMLSVS